MAVDTPSHASERHALRMAGGRRQRYRCWQRLRDTALRLSVRSGRGRSPGLRAKAWPSDPRLPMRAAQWPVWIALRAYRCGGSSGITTLGGAPDSRFNRRQHAGDHLEPVHLRACVPGRLEIRDVPAAFDRNKLRWACRLASRYTSFACRDNDACPEALGACAGKHASDMDILIWTLSQPNHLLEERRRCH
jgi:hypothetical protein